ncbi:MAG TPA: hypothetical protein VFS37_13675 [Conexibacter sp.]|nr:hypothetical protein [Conexibacter sp.]
MKLCKLLLATVAATVLLGALAGAASARNYSSTSQTWRSSFREVRFNGVFGNITCQMTLEGSMHSRTITKEPFILIGYVTTANLGPCAEGRATILRETLPWHERRLRFTRILPNFGSVTDSIGFNFRIQEPFAGCLASSTAERPALLTFNREVTGVLTTAEVGGTIPTSCGVEGSFTSSRGPVTVLNSSTRITLGLI